MAKKKIKAPAGYHWMKQGTKAPKLMKHSGKFVPHKGASLYASFDIQTTHGNGKNQKTKKSR